MPKKFFLNLFYKCPFFVTIIYYVHRYSYHVCMHVIEHVIVWSLRHQLHLVEKTLNLNGCRELFESQHRYQSLEKSLYFIRLNITSLESIFMELIPNAGSGSRLYFLIFKGENYEHWSIKMRTLLKLQELWDLIEKGSFETDDEQWLRDNGKKDAKAHFLI